MSNVFLNEGELPFKMLSGNEMEVIVANIENLDRLSEDGWKKKKDKALHPGSVYRTRPQKDCFGWSSVAPMWKHLRRDKSGQVFLYDTKPVLNSTEKWWECCDDAGGVAVEISDLFSSYKNNGMPWNEMILDRPESEEDL